MEGILLQRWLTIRCDSPTVTSLAQPAEDWIDLASYADATFWIDVTDFTAPSGSTVQLGIQTSPSLDESYFNVLAPPVQLSGPPPISVKLQSLRTPATSPLARFVRWRLTLVGGGSGTWGATFRIRAVPSKQQLFLPTSIPKCLLWLRSDLGVTTNGTKISAWADQTGNGNNVSQSMSARQPTYVTSGGPNNVPYINFTRFSTQNLNIPAFSCPEPLEWCVAASAPANSTSTAFLVAQSLSGGSAVNIHCVSSLPGAPIGGEEEFTVGDVNATSQPSVTITENQDFIINGWFDGVANIGMNMNNGNLGSGTGATTGSTGNAICIGNNQDNGTSNLSWHGHVYEVCLYGAVLTLGQRKILTEYLGRRYNIVVL
jgi:hypothetical protein